MKGELYVYYDEEGDFLELNIGNYTEGYFRDVGEGVSERIDEKTGKVTGIAILGFKERTRGMSDVRVKLPFKLELIA
ncbi:DUF2283 domain-containing protein [Candidatus Woesearchaeota archaeon]|nr:DUF2283 domain-containing protein [Candidatus Woesearchaeota archaeon]